jgi:chromosome segregation ATPase
MSVVQNLEALIKIEDELKAKYETKLAELAAEIDAGIKKHEALQNIIGEQQKKINELTDGSSETKRLEQLNRELNNRADNLQEEVDAQKKRVKAMRKELTQEREEVKKLKHLDAEKLKKNLVANKKKLAEKNTANDLLQKSLNKAKSENAELTRELEELKARLAELEPVQEDAQAELEEAAVEKETKPEKKSKSEKKASAGKDAKKESVASAA